MPTELWAQEAYAVLSEENTVLTFYYDENKENRGGLDIEFNMNNYNTNKHWDGHYGDIKMVSFDSSFANYTTLTSTAYWFAYCQQLEQINGLEYLNTINVTDMDNMFWYCSSLKTLDVSMFKTDNVTDMSGMFRGSYNLESLDLSSFNTSKVKSFKSMFAGCRGLKNLIVPFDTSNATDLYGMFTDCSGLTSLDVSSFKTDKVTDMSYLFNFCSSLTTLDVSNFNTENVTKMHGMFGNCSGLLSLKLTNFNTGKVTDMGHMFSGCTALTGIDLSTFNTESVESMVAMFQNCKKMSSIDVSGFKTDNVTDMSYMFNACNSLASINVSGFKTDKVTTMSGMFQACSSLTNINVSTFNTTNVGNMGSMFSGCSGLTSLDVSNFNAPNLMTLMSMFSGCIGISTLNLSGFNTKIVSDMSSMFNDCSALTQILVGNEWSTAGIAPGGGDNMFTNCTNLVGGAGTIYDANHVDYTYAHIDGGSSNPGYLTAKDAKVWSVIGTINGEWDTDTEMTSEDGVNYRASFPYMAAGKYEFKIRANGDWAENYGADGKQDGSNVVATVEEDLSGVIVMFNAETKEITYSIMPPVYSVTGSKVDEDGNSISGWLNWADDADMTKDENGIYSVTFDNMEVGYYSFKVRVNHEWTYNWGADGELGGANMLLTIAQAGPVTIYFDPETHLASTAYPQKLEQVATPTFSWNEDKLTISSETEGATITYKFEDGYYLVGGNGEWSSDKTQKMSQSSEEYIYTYVLQGFDTDLWFAFGDVAALNAIADGDWSHLFGATVDGSELSGKYDRRYNLGADNSFHVDGSAAYYRFTINTQDKTYLIEPLDSDPGFIASSDVVYTYTDPVEIKSDVFMTAVAKKEGMKDSETTTLDYPYTAWRDLRDAEDKGQSVIMENAGNDKVPEKLLDELKYYMDEAHQMYVQRTAERASIENMTAKLLSLIEDVLAMASAEDIIQFADSVAKTICVANWDTNGDGELSKTEAAAVTSIGTVFKGNTTIGSFNELKYFTGLQSLSIGAFEESSVTSLELPDGLIEIGSDAFSQCRQLKSIFIPATVSKMGSDSGMAEFWLCYNLETISVDENNKFYTAVDNVLFNKEMNKIIRYPAAKPDVAYEIPNTVTTINQNCFESCSSLMAVNIPASVTEMGYGVFQQCDNLITVTISDGVTVIGEDAFRSCKRLAHIHIPASVKQIGREDRSPENAFFWSDALEEITVDENNPYFMSDGGILYSKDKSIIAAYPPALTASEFTVPYGVTKISSCCFTGTENLKSIHFPETVVAYDNAAINISNSTLQSLKVMATTPATIENNAFSDAVYFATLYVPNGTVEAYRNATGWKEFKNIVEMEPDVNYSFDYNGVLWVDSDVTMAQVMEEANQKHNVAEHITAIVWHSSQPLTNSDLQVFDNPNMLIYVDSDSLAPQNRDNVVVGNYAKNIVLTDVASGNGSFYCPQEFTAEMISYTHEYKQKTEVGVSRGWETIALPFDVQTVMHEKNGLIAPFGNSTSDKHFWLRQLTHQGLEQATAIQANWPYLISMPNSETYTSSYNLAGRVTFSAQNVVVPETEEYGMDMYSEEGGMVMMRATFSGVSKSAGVYALNVGEARGNNPEGSVFEVNYRDIRPFEAYTIHEGNGPAPQFIPVAGFTDGEATGIEDVRSLMSDGRGEGAWYDLNGRKLQHKPTQKGVYLNNGHKVVIR